MAPTVRVAAVANASHRWRLHGQVGAVELDVYFDVPNSYQWSEHLDSGRIEDPGTHEVTVMVTTDGSPGKYSGQPPIELRGPQAKAVVADLRRAFELTGPWTLVTPTETLTVVVDPGLGDFGAHNYGRYWGVAVGFQQVDD